MSDTIHVADPHPRSWPALRNVEIPEHIRGSNVPAIEFRDSGDRDDRYFEWLARLPEAERARRGLGE